VGRRVRAAASLRLQSRARKKRLARVLKEFRKSTQALPDAGIVLDRDNVTSRG
jgi:two-component system, OmpR family, phosphate regulon sensor histidine kinase PhoR